MQSYTLEEIRDKLEKQEFPMEGITALGTARFCFREPAGTLGIALHAGSSVRQDMLEIMEVSAEERCREEDPHTDIFVKDFPMQIIALDSRFEYDLNRDMKNCIYSYHVKQWGLQVWSRPLTTEEIEFTLQKYREFHELLEMVIDHILGYSRIAILFDVHSYCYQRERKTEWWKDERPEINLGTKSIHRQHFAPLIDAFLERLSRTRVDRHQIRVAENAIFPGGYLTRKYAGSHPESVLVLAIEYKKIFMNEWTGELHTEILSTLVRDLVRARDHIMQ